MVQEDREKMGETQSEEKGSNQTLDQLIPQFGEKNETVKSLKKELDSIGTTIKEIMRDGIDKYPAGDFIATYVVKVSNGMDEEYLLSQLQSEKLRKTADSLGLIKTKEYVDMDALENAIYHGKLDEETLDIIRSAQTTKEIPTLTVKKVKGKKK